MTVFTIEEAAEYLKVSVRTLYHLAPLKKIPAKKIGGQWRFVKEALDKWLVEDEKEFCVDPRFIERKRFAQR